jgi:hypothetical protein
MLHARPITALALLALAGCAVEPNMNPAFPITIDEAQAALDQMKATPKQTPRPVIVAAGYLDPGFISWDVARRLKRATQPDAEILSVSFFWAMNFDAARDRLIAAVERAHPCDDPALTCEVDVVGYSMGGLVARYAATPLNNGSKRLNIARLFTISTPHRGATLAPLAPFDPRASAMTTGSDFLTLLDHDLEHARFPIIPYVRLSDAVIGEHNAAPPGCEPWWVPNRPFSMSHNLAGTDPRIIADIARRLRDEQPFTREPATPVPQWSFTNR